MCVLLCFIKPILGNRYGPVTVQNAGNLKRNSQKGTNDKRLEVGGGVVAGTRSLCTKLQLLSRDSPQKCGTGVHRLPPVRCPPSRNRKSLLLLSTGAAFGIPELDQPRNAYCVELAALRLEVIRVFARGSPDFSNALSRFRLASKVCSR